MANLNWTMRCTLPLFLSFSGWVQAQIATDPCKFVTVAEVAASGGKQVTTLSYDPGSVLKKSDLPALPTDLRIDQCVGPVLLSNAVTFRLGLMRPRDVLDQAGWTKIDALLEDSDKKGPTRPKPVIKLGESQCEAFDWAAGTKAKPQKIFEVSCTTFSGARALTVSFEHHDKDQLPSLGVVKALLEKLKDKLK